MDIKAKKKELIEWIENLDDIEILKSLKIIKEQSGSVSWDDLPNETKESIERAEKDIKAGCITPHEDVRKSYE